MEEIADLLETLYETAGFSTQAVATRAADLFISLDLNQVQRLKSETHLKSEIFTVRQDGELDEEEFVRACMEDREIRAMLITSGSVMPRK